MPRLQVGDRVVLRSGHRACSSPMGFARLALLHQQLHADEGPLSPGDVGEIVAVDGSNLPYKVRVGSREHWYPEEAVDRYVPNGVQVTAYEVEFDQRTWWYDNQALQKHQASETPLEAGLLVGDFAVLSRDYQKFPDATKGPLWPGAIGKIVAYHLEVDGRTWWYDKADKEALVNYVGRASPDKPKARPSVGDKVVLSENFRTFPDAENGPLAEGDVGTVLECDRSHLPYLVEFGSSTHWYAAGAIEKQAAKPGESDSEATTADTASPIKVGDLVRVSPAVKSPRYGWGGVDHSMVGKVVAEDGDSLRVEFPGHSRWHGRREEMEKAADQTAVPSTPSGLVRVVVTNAGASDLNGTYVHAGRDWNGKPLYKKEGTQEGLYCYYTDRAGQVKGWNLGPGDTTSWIYFAPGELRVPPPTGWTAKDGSSNGLPAVALTSGLQASPASATAKAPGRRPNPWAALDPASGSDSDEELAESGSEANLMCPQGHPLVAFTTDHSGYGCDSAACRGKARKPRGERMHGCRKCNYDLCAECEGDAQAAARSEAAAKAEVHQEASENKEEGRVAEELRACGECGQDGDDGWTSYGDYYCVNCWAGWLSPAPANGGGHAAPAPGGEEGKEASREEHKQEQAASGEAGRPAQEEEEAGTRRRGLWRWRHPRSLCGLRRRALPARATSR